MRKMPGPLRILPVLVLAGACFGAAPVAAQTAGDIAAFERAWGAYEREAEDYWRAVGEKRSARAAKRRNKQRITLADYVLEQPPVYSGPPRPPGPKAPP